MSWHITVCERMEEDSQGHWYIITDTYVSILKNDGADQDSLAVGAIIKEVISDYKAKNGMIKTVTLKSDNAGRMLLMGFGRI